MHRSFCILNVVGDLLADGELQFLETAKSLEAARRRITVLGLSRPGEYVIYNQVTGERVSIKAGRETAGIAGRHSNLAQKLNIGTGWFH